MAMKIFVPRTHSAECIVRNEILNWFKDLIEKSCDPELNIRWFSIEDHFSTHTRVEFSGSENQIIKAVEFLGTTSEKLQYQMPWLTENTYYILGGLDGQKAVIEKLANIKDNGCNTDYYVIPYAVIGISLNLFNFRPDLDETKRKEIDDVFKSSTTGSSMFITYPKRRNAEEAQPTQSTGRMATNVLIAYRGQFLHYLSLEDILSLELANKMHNPFVDTTLNHDIQKFIKDYNHELLRGPKIDYLNLRNFKINTVLRYFIHQYHDRFKQIGISNILTVEEMRLLSYLYNIEFDYNKINHIDFKSTNDPEINDFCALYHFDPTLKYFLNYDPKYTNENYSIKFNDDDSLDLLNCNKEFVYFILKSRRGSSSQKTNSVLKSVAEHFRFQQNYSVLVLFQFDLNRVPAHILNALLCMMCNGLLTFNEMEFKFETLSAILNHSKENNLYFIKCHVTKPTLDLICNNSTKPKLSFYDMDVELYLFRILQKSKSLLISNCRVLSSSWQPTIYTEFCDYIIFQYTTFDIQTLLRLLYGLQTVSKLYFLSCSFTSCELIEKRQFTVQSHIWFTNMVFDSQSLFQIFENCEFQKRAIFQNCYFSFTECYAINTFSCRPAHIQFNKINFNLATLFTILETLNKKSEVIICGSTILPPNENDNISAKLIQVESIDFLECELQIQTLLKILDKLSKQSQIIIQRCVLLQTPADKLLLRKIEVPTEVVQFKSLNHERKFNIKFLDMAIEIETVRPIFYCQTVSISIATFQFPTDSKISFQNCDLKFFTDNYPDIPIQSHVVFDNVSFDSAAHIRWLTNFTPQSEMEFHNCHFDHITSVFTPDFEFKPLVILFSNITFDFMVLINIMEKISRHTHVTMVGCSIRPKTITIMIGHITIPVINFRDMDLKTDIILSILDNFTNPLMVQFINCSISCSTQHEVSNKIIKSPIVIFMNMDVNVAVFQQFVQHFIKGSFVIFDNSNIITEHNSVLPSVSVDIARIGLLNVNYSPGVLQMLQCLTGQFIVEYNDQLSNQAITEICTKTLVRGERLQLMTLICTKSIYFELFAEYFRSAALNYESGTEVEYDPPVSLIPYIRSLSGDNQFDWNEFKIRCIPVTNSAMKLEFLRNRIPIDLFYELNDLPDDSDECVVDYY